MRQLLSNVDTRGRAAGPVILRDSSGAIKYRGLAHGTEDSAARVATDIILRSTTCSRSCR